MAVIECIPNVSEGRRLDVVEDVANAIRYTPGITLLDRSADGSHNRSVFTFVGDAAAVEAAVLALFECALARIDLRTHRGEHPRIGAVDVVPLVPLEDVEMPQCVELAKKIASRVAGRFQVPVFLYEEASANPRRRRLEQIRQGGLEALAARMTADEWIPDFGPRQPHPSAGASVIGARGPLIAFNVNLATDRLDVAKRAAESVRESSGGLPGIKALGIELRERGIVQVSTNVTNFRETPLSDLFDAIEREAARYGVHVLGSELVGLVPSAALDSEIARRIQLNRSLDDIVLERQLARHRPIQPPGF
jgi:glutamate formiminotransferase